MASIGVQPADVEPKATEHIPQMVELIGRLIRRGVAYELDGDVYFEVRRFPHYGKLSGKNLDELESGARVDVDQILAGELAVVRQAPDPQLDLPLPPLRNKS